VPPLYHQYQDSFGLTPFAVVIIFASYVLSLLAALLTVDSLSDLISRRPAILAALVLNVVSMAMFMTASSEAALIAARASPQSIYFPIHCCSCFEDVPGSGAHPKRQQVSAGSVACVI
jgi:MFS family permease